MVAVNSIPVGGYELDDAIVRFIQQREKLLVGQEQAETLKLAIGSATAQAYSTETADVAGRDLVTGLLRRVTVDAGQIREAISRPLAQIVAAVKDLLERTPAELSSDLADRGLIPHRPSRVRAYADFQAFRPIITPSRIDA